MTPTPSPAVTISAPFCTIFGGFNGRFPLFARVLWKTGTAGGSHQRAVWSMQFIAHAALWRAAVPSLLLFLLQARLCQIDVALNAPQDVVIDHLLVAQLQDHFALYLQQLIGQLPVLRRKESPLSIRRI